MLRIITILVLFSVSQIEGSEFTDQPKILGKLLGQIKADGFKHCLRVDIVLFGSAGSLGKESFLDDSVYFTVNRNIFNVREMENFCAILIAQERDNVSINDIFEAIQHQGQSLLILFGSKNENDLVFDAERKEKHLIYIKRTQDQHYILFVFCGGHYDRGAYFWNIWKNGTFAYPTKSIKTICPYVLAERHLNISLSYLHPLVMRDSQTGEWGGPEVGLMLIMAEKFNFTFTLLPSEFPSNAGNPTERYLTRNTSTEMLYTWKAIIALGCRSYYYEMYQFVDFVSPISTYSMLFATRIPIARKTFNQLFEPFSWTIWVPVYVTLLCLSLTFALIFKVYKSLEGYQDHLLQQQNVLWADFLILPFAKFVEPDPIPWFRAWSTGKMAILLWSFYTMLIVFFYSSNLRAFLLKEDLEKRVDTLEDVLERDRTVYIFDLEALFDYKNPVVGQYLTPVERAVSKRSYDTNGRFSLKDGLFPRYAKDDVIDNGAVMRVSFENILYDEILFKTTKGLGTFYVSKEEDTTFFSFHIRKYSPYRKDLDLALAQLRDMGFYLQYLYGPIPLSAREKWTPSQSRPNETPLALYQIMVIFLLLLLGALIGTLVFICELRAAKKKQTFFKEQ